jgi:uncharacterized protein
MEMESYEPGTPSWIDLGTEDIDATVAFYGTLLGWTTPAGPPEAGGYRVAELRGKPVAGLGPKMNPGPPAWTSYVSVADADETLAKVTAAGGTVLMPSMDVMGIGKMAVFMDNAGAALALWQPGLFAGAGLVNEPGSLVWNELSTRDIDAAKSFYPAVFGWEASTVEDGPMPYTEFKLNDRSIAGMMPMPEMVPAEVPNYWGIYLGVSDTDGAVATTTAAGGTVLLAPMDIPIGRFAVLTDPQGAVFSVISLNDAAAAE